MIEAVGDGVATEWTTESLVGEPSGKKWGCQMLWSVDRQLFAGQRDWSTTESYVQPNQPNVEQAMKSTTVGLPAYSL